MRRRCPAASCGEKVRWIAGVVTTLRSSQEVGIGQARRSEECCLSDTLLRLLIGCAFYVGITPFFFSIHLNLMVIEWIMEQHWVTPCCASENLECHRQTLSHSKTSLSGGCTESYPHEKNLRRSTLRSSLFPRIVDLIFLFLASPSHLWQHLSMKNKHEYSLEKKLNCLHC